MNPQKALLFMHYLYRLGASFLLSPLLLSALPAQAQSITPAADGTGTQVILNGQRYDIGGGSLSGDGANLFHSFQEFGLSPSEIAHFLANPQLQNILGRVTGGNVSVIDGLIQVSGGSPNLYLMNPAGMVFGPNASLNVPASFTATTADAIGFGNGQWFTATGPSSFSSLTGPPNQFAFTSLQPGSIVNAGNLAVPSGNNLALLGGTAINSGSLSAPNGNLTIAAVPGGQTLRLSQTGMVLGLEVAPQSLSSGIQPTDLPALLASPSIQNATGASIAANGTVHLSGSGVTVTPGSATIAGSVQGNQVHLAAAQRVQPVGDPTQVISTHDGLYSAPTVTHFAQSAADPSALIFLDVTIPDYASLLYSGKAGSTTVAVVPTESGMVKVTNTLALLPNPIDELHIVSEGDEGDFWLGNDYVSAETLGRYQGQLQQWGASLSSSADILIYACMTAFGQGGDALLNAIANLTGADVAGSTNLTGSAAKGGDWVLEKNTGSIEATAAFDATALASYDDVLQLFTATNVAELESHINTANANGEDDTIRLAASTNFLLTAALPTIVFDGTLTIEGMGGSIIDGNNSVRPFTVAVGADLTLDNLTVRNGQVTGDGGGIFNSGTLNISDSIISGNSATGDGGGIFNSGTLNISDSIISGNSATGDGGGIFNSGTATVTSSIISANQASNSGGGIFNSGTLTVTGSTIAGNAAVSNGGGIANVGNTSSVNNTITGNAPDDVSGNPLNATGGTTGGAIDNMTGNTTVATSTGNAIVTGNRNTSRVPLQMFDPILLSEIEDEPLIVLSPPRSKPLDAQLVEDLEDDFNEEFEAALGVRALLPKTLADARKALREIEQITGIRAAIVYAYFASPSPEQGGGGGAGAVTQRNPRSQADNAVLTLLVVTANSTLGPIAVPDAPRAKVLSTAQQLTQRTTRAYNRRYRKHAQQLHHWLIAPMEAALAETGIENVSFILDKGLRSIPLGALHDGEQFLIERYSVGIMPTLSLTDTRYFDLKQAQILAMGASEFTELPPLPAVPFELSLIAKTLWPGEIFLNENFTQQNLMQARSQEPFEILHLATHAAFLPDKGDTTMLTRQGDKMKLVVGKRRDSYIQFGDGKFTLDELPKLSLWHPQVKLLVLSACQTAWEEENALLGFSGLAIQSGATAAMGSFWSVSDEGTMGLMTSFYEELQQAPIKSEALRRAQVAMLRGEIRFEEGELVTPRGRYPLPPELENSRVDLRHPYYWSAFTTIGNPW